MDSGFSTDNVSAALQAILTRKAEEKRQAFLDSITKQNADTNRMQAESEIKWREGQAKREEAIANKEWLNDMSEGQDLSDEDVSRMQKIGQGGAVRSTPTGDVEPYNQRENGFIDEGPVQVMKNTYAGSPQEQQASKQREAIGKLMQADPEFTKKPFLQQWLTLQNLGIKVSPKDLRDPEDEQIPLVWVDRQGNPHDKGKFPKGTHFANQPAPPGQGASESYTLVDDDGDEKTPPLAFGNKTRTLYPLKGKDGVEVPSTLRKVGTNIPQTPTPKEKLWQKSLGDVRQAMQARGRAGNNVRPAEKSILDGAINAARARTIGLYDDYQLSDPFRQELVRIVTSPSWSVLSPDSIITQLNKRRVEKGSEPLTDEQILIMRTLLPQVLGK